MPATTSFDPRQYLIQLKGKLYLETKYRIQWYRTDHPRGCISTEIVSYDPMMVRATVFDGEGNVLATAHAGAVDKGNAVWSGRALEKSETAAIGRALAHAGYGTQFAGPEDTPREASRRDPAPRQTSSSPTPPARQPASASRSWLDNVGAPEGFERRLLNSGIPAAHANRAGAEALLKGPLTAFSGSEEAFRAVQQAWQDFVALEPA